MDVEPLYDLLRHLCQAGREIAAAQQQGIEEGSAHGHEPVVVQLHHVDVVQGFAQATASHQSGWQGIPQAGISLADVSR